MCYMAYRLVCRNVDESERKYEMVCVLMINIQGDLFKVKHFLKYLKLFKFNFFTLFKTFFKILYIY